MRILVLQLKRIGDAILTTPLLAVLRERVPGCEITIALDSSTSGLAPALDADHTLIFRRGLAGLSFWGALAKGGFDVCLDVTGNDRSAAAATISRARRRITWARIARKLLRKAIYTQFVESSVKERHTADHHTDLLRALDIEVENVPLHLNLPRAAKDEAAQAIENAGLTTPFAVVHAGTARAEKYWRADRWAEVIEHLRTALGLAVVLTGSDDSSERVHLDAIQNGLKAKCPSLAGKLSLLATAAVIGKARLLCAVDSAPVHLADALGTPLVALFGPTNPFHWRPRSASSRIVTAAQVENIAPNFPKSPMDDIPAARVIAAIRDLA